jgi:hypothetical protein
LVGYFSNADFCGADLSGVFLGTQTVQEFIADMLRQGCKFDENTIFPLESFFRPSGTALVDIVVNFPMFTTEHSRQSYFAALTRVLDPMGISLEHFPSSRPNAAYIRFTIPPEMFKDNAYDFCARSIRLLTEIPERPSDSTYQDTREDDWSCGSQPQDRLALIDRPSGKGGNTDPPITTVQDNATHVVNPNLEELLQRLDQMWNHYPKKSFSFAVHGESSPHLPLVGLIGPLVHTQPSDQDETPWVEPIISFRTPAVIAALHSTVPACLTCPPGNPTSGDRPPHRRAPRHCPTQGLAGVREWQVFQGFWQPGNDY